MQFKKSLNLFKKIPVERFANLRVISALTMFRLGIIAGAGTLPRRIADHFDPSGNSVFFLAMEGITDPSTLVDRDHAWVKLGQLEIGMTKLLAAKVSKVVMAGPVRRPAFSSLDLDKRASQMLLRGGVKIFGDDGFLSLLILEIEKDGLTVIGIDQLLSDLLTRFGHIVGPVVDDVAEKDIDRGVGVLLKLGAADVGQSIAVQEGLVLAIEAAEGTDGMIRRAGQIKREVLGPILVKMSKPGQERRADLPTVGPETIKLAVACGFRGLALEEGGTLLLDRDIVKDIASKAGFFIVGIKVPGS
jgi:DUF1009 family protein